MSRFTAAADLLERAERRATTFRLSAVAAKLLGIVGLALGLYCSGEHAGRVKAQANQLRAALDTNARRVAAATQKRDSTRTAASHEVARADSQRVVTKAVEARVRILTDSSVAISDSADHNTYVMPVPPLVVTELVQDRAQISQDTITIRAVLARADAADSLSAAQAERIALLDAAIKQSTRSAFWTGVKAGAIALAVAEIGAKLLLHH